MEVAEVHRLVATVGSVDPACRDRARLTAAAGSVARLRAWLDGVDVRLAAGLAEVVSYPEQALAEAARTSLREAGRVVERVLVTDQMPALGAALSSGDVSGAHVDAVGRGLRALEPGLRSGLVERAAWLTDLAARSTPGEFGRVVAAEVRRLQTDGGMGRLERQRRATRLDTWVDRDGMWRLSGRFDPQTALSLDQRLRRAVERLFADRVPDCCPTDPLAKQAFLRAHALIALTQGAGGAGGVDVTVVVDATAPDPATGGPVIDWGLPVELPAAVLRRWFTDADVACVVVRNGVVVHTPGCVDLGRSTRVASRAQRRVLRGLYPTCAIAGCGARFANCDLHHVVWWRHGGATDLANLVPLCVRHHHAVHDHGWQLSLSADRQLTVTYPDGNTRTTGPPRRGASAQPKVAAPGKAYRSEPIPVLRT